MRSVMDGLQETASVADTSVEDYDNADIDPDTIVGDATDQMHIRESFVQLAGSLSGDFSNAVMDASPGKRESHGNGIPHSADEYQTT